MAKKKPSKFVLPTSPYFFSIGCLMLLNELAITSRPGAPNAVVVLAGLVCIGVLPVDLFQQIINRKVSPDDDEDGEK